MSTDTMTLKAGVYGRESKDKTKSVDDQVGIGEATITEQGWTHAGSWRDGTGASRTSKGIRRGWVAVRAAIEARDLDVLVLWETSRGSRTMREWVAMLDTCAELRVRLHIVSHERTYLPWKATDRKSLINDGADAEFETGRLSERVCRGVDSAAVAGGFHGRIPYGYMRVTVGEKKTSRGELRPVREQRPDPDTAPIVLEIITRVASKEPLGQIIRNLNDRKIAPPGGGRRWGYDQIHNLVANRSYIGQRSHTPVAGGAATVHKGTWPAIVSEAMWTCANEVLRKDQAKQRQANAPGALKYLLTSIMRAPCGGPIVSKHEGNGARRYRYVCGDDACVSCPMAPADEWVTHLLIARLCKPDARDMFCPDDTATRAAKDELARLEQQLEEARAAYDRDDISLETMIRKEKALKPKIADADRRSRPAGVSLVMLRLLTAAETGEQHVRPVWDALSLPGRREAITLVFERLTLGQTTVRLTRYTVWEERLEIIGDRIRHVWRQRS